MKYFSSLKRRQLGDHPEYRNHCKQYLSFSLSALKEILKSECICTWSRSQYLIRFLKLASEPTLEPLFIRFIIWACDPSIDNGNETHNSLISASQSANFSDKESIIRGITLCSSIFRYPRLSIAAIRSSKKSSVISVNMTTFHSTFITQR